ncbi:MAG TPA: 2'-5' RNA ligase family protein [Gaiellaceae bacterium]|nr:2'-5' RNA ligase family protein [Gaiellaceae bacterium]
MNTAVVLVLEGEAPDLAGARAELDPESARKLPLHLTLLYPFVPRVELDDAALAALHRFFEGRPPPVFALTRVDLLAGTWVYAVPEPADSLELLLEALWARYPQLPPYAGEIADPVPHATLARVDPAEADATLRGIDARVAPLLPVACAPRAASLLEELTDGTWRELASLPFAGAAAA